MDEYDFDTISGVTPIEDVFYEKPNYNSVRPTPVRGYARPTYNDLYDKPFAQPSVYAEPFEPMNMNVKYGSPVSEIKRPPPSMMKRPYGNMTENPSSISCQDIAKHVANCPICSSVYKRHDYIYIGVIVILLIVIFFLLRKHSY